MLVNTVILKKERKKNQPQSTNAFANRGDYWGKIEEKFEVLKVFGS